MEKIIFEDLPSTNTPISSTNLNQLQTNIENAINGVVESGSNNNGEWIKYANGTMICKGTWNIGAYTTGGNTIGNLWYGDINIWHQFPQPFVSRPTVNFDIYDIRNDFGGGLWVQKKANSIETARFGGFRILSATNTSMNVSIDFIAIGNWK